MNSNYTAPVTIKLTKADKKVWKAGSELQRNRTKSQSGPSFIELAEIAGLSKSAVIYAVRRLVARGYATHDPKIARSLWFTKLAPKDETESGSNAAD